MYAIYIHENHRIFDYNSTTQICNYRLLQIFKCLRTTYTSTCKLSITLVTHIIVTIEQRQIVFTKNFNFNSSFNLDSATRKSLSTTMNK